MFIVTTYNGVIKFDCYFDLLNYISSFSHYTISGYRNYFLEHVGGNDKDLMLDLGSNPPEYIRRPYRIQNESGANLYCKSLIYDVKKHSYNQYIAKARIEKSYLDNQSKSYKYRSKSKRGKFRDGPWPTIGHKFCYRWFRRIRTTNERRHYYDDNVASLTRASRGKNLPDTWDEITRDYHDKGWKSQCKYKHQWEHRLNPHNKRIDTIKCADKWSIYIV